MQQARNVVLIPQQASCMFTDAARHLLLRVMCCCLCRLASVFTTDDRAHILRGLLPRTSPPAHRNHPCAQASGWESAAHLEGQQRVALGRGRGGAEVAADVRGRRRLAGLPPLWHRLQQRPRQLHQLLVLHTRPCNNAPPCCASRSDASHEHHGSARRTPLSCRAGAAAAALALRTLLNNL